MSQRILSISGLRGLVGDGLDPEYVTHFAASLGTMYQGGTVILSRDGRGTGEMLRHAVLAGLLGTGCRVLDLGIASTPTCGVMVQHLGAAGGLQLTASHNPIEWNGLKPFSPLGGVFDQALGQQLLAQLEQPPSYRPWDGLGSVELLPHPSAVHLDKVLRLVDGERIRQRRFKVVLDCNHGSGAVFGPRLLETLGCDVVVMGGSPDGQFAHPAEPLADNLSTLMDAVRHNGADVGFAQDPDADRLAIVDNTGRYIGEELTLALCVDLILARTPGPVVVNGSTSRVTADLAAKYGCAFHRSHVGEANVVSKMREVAAVIGGEGNGGVIEPQVGFVRDSFVSMAYVLDGLAGRRTALSDWVDELPQYTIIKDKLHCPRERVAAACAALKQAYADATVSEGDGLRLDWPDRWVQVRASNTEPIIRVIAEAPDGTLARSLCAEAVELAKRAVR
ncbi:phosphoglucosamine mutase [Planctellipticum variicoloris]|uniref:phosphoglucosamine mutase n=1 Tax=Planctellipticum variicoloris TaxID=3064265 RepID=UPI003013E66B|nr:phosphoglucosamine mutase [Planctomycetaceae bacterium SH412]